MNAARDFYAGDYHRLDEAQPIPPTRPPTPAEVAGVSAWLDHIGETDSAIRDEVLTTCRADAGTLQCILRRAVEAGIVEPTGSGKAGGQCCGDCAHFQPDAVGDGTGIGQCREMDNPPGGLLYPKVERLCRQFAPKASTTNPTTGTSEARP